MQDIQSEPINVQDRLTTNPRRTIEKHESMDTFV